MQTSGSQKIKTGIFAIAAIAIFLVIIVMIGRQKSMFTDTFPVYANFKNVSGLQTGNFVRFAGINVGTVSGITIVNDSTVKVDMLLQARVKPYIKSDSKASIASDGLMGDKLLQISPGSPTGQLKDNQVTGVEPMDFDKVMAKLAVVADNASTITSDLAGITGKLNSGKGSLGRLLNSDEFEKKIESTVSSANQTVQSIGKAAGGVSENMEAAKHSFLLRGFFKKKEKKRLEDSTRIADSIKNLKPVKKK